MPIEDISERIVIGLTEEVVIITDKRTKFRARIDTGATRNSIDEKIAHDLNLGPVIRKKKVKSAQGSEVRPVIECTIEVKGVHQTTEFTVASREHMKYPVLIGRNFLKEGGFLIDPTIE